MTTTGLVVLPLALLIILLPWRFSIVALPVFATLNSAAVVNVGSFGLQPGFFFGMLIIARTLVEIVLFDTRLNANVLKMLTPLLIFTIICFVAIWIALTFFQGRVMVVSSTAAFNLDLAQPYSFDRQNLTQPFYLLLNVGIVYALAHQIASLREHQITRTLDRAIIGAILFSSLVTIWEMAGFYFGVPFFPEFFHSNAGYYAAHGQVLFGDILRPSGPFTEPSDLAYYFAAFLMYAWYRHLRKPSAATIAIVLLCLALMAASTSTTAYAVLGVFALVVAKDIVVAIVTGRTRIKLSLRHVGVVVLLAIAALGTLSFAQAHWHEIDSVVKAMVLEKKQSSSFKARSGADMMALEIVLQTGGVGIGLGSHKPNNLAMTLLSNTGIVGFLVFGIFLLGLLWPRPATSPGLDIRPYRWMILGLLSVHMISNPNFNPIMLWISLAVIVGALAAQGTSPMVSTCRTPVRTAGVAPGFSAQRTPWQRPAARLPTGRSV